MNTNEDIKFLAENKKLVFEWLGWSFFYSTPVNITYLMFKKKPEGMAQRVDNWNPHKNRNCWGGIWLNMDGDFFAKYLSNYEAIPQKPILKDYRIHTASPEICWEALIETLKQETN